MMTFDVEDTGIGVPEEEQCRIVDYFRQPGDTDTKTFQRAVTGLSMVKNVTVVLGVNAYLEPTRGKGSIFPVELPSSGALVTLNSETSPL